MRRWLRSLSISAVVLRSSGTAVDDASAGGDVRRLVVVPDAHGDPEALTSALGLAGISVPRDAAAESDGGAHVLSLGDSVDRGPRAKGCYKILQDVNATRILGNHDWLAILGVDEKDDPSTPQDEHFFAQYVTEEDLATFGGWANRREAFSRHGALGRSIREQFEIMALLPSRWARYNELPGLDAAATVFMHGGITEQLASEFGSVAAMASTGKDALRRSLEGDDNGLLSNLFNEVLQDRHLTFQPEKSGGCEELERTLQLLGAARLIVGHTPQVSRRAGVKCGGRLILLDIAMSRWLMNLE
eukprot:CAMPEP_0178441236 /NCGR_PEP_ID=MMETSP0689_2-20121128/37359_1 /TAXON_ID=160604 /ORGANISM="Amphidinium massartii, Strain CS-259" /LENGTH=301 /DNA_ID=CAMNT_0020064373 /DNA_START=33 /DNA_END=935 /DNA_ORIENTATION=+